MRIPIEEFLLWVVLPFLNFAIWFYLSHSGSFHHCDPTKQLVNSPMSLERLLDQSLEQIAKETAAVPCAEHVSEYSKQCNLRVSQATDKFKLEFEDTYKFDKFRANKLASMTVDILLKTYSGTDTAVLKKESDEECQTMDIHMIDSHPDTCFAVFTSPTITMTNNLARVDQDIDIYGLSISNPDPSQVDKYSTKFALNEHNEGKFWPQGFFRKVPKERGRERTLDKLGKFLENFDEINEQFLAKINSHNIKAGDDLVAMVVNEGELDLFLNFACSCRLHNISMNNILAFVGSRFVSCDCL